jgi:putative Ca2+/H+ antiporter (TMEM165/GDT1 family)
MDLIPLVVTFLIIAAAELGDKTQLLTLAFATRFAAWKVIVSVTAATATLMALAVFFGGVIHHYIPEFHLQLLAGSLFILFGFWILFGKEEDEEKAKEKLDNNPFLLIFSAFFLAELGDKTQLAALVLSARYGDPFQVWLGATLGMASVNVIAALAGSWIRKLISAKTVRFVSSAFFIVFGAFTLFCLFIGSELLCW